MRARKPPLKDLTGQKFRFLEVIKMAQTEKSGKKGTWRAICKCHNCGKGNVDIHPGALRRGATGSCGCDKSRYLKTRGKNSVQFTGYEEISGRFWGKFKKKTVEKKRHVEIDIKYAWELFLKQNKKCAISGIPLNFAKTSGNLKDGTASLDRIDSSKGYEKDNIQWVHKDINRMKSDFDENYFIKICNLIAKQNPRDVEESPANQFSTNI